jgi:Na+/H+ antiporter NhaC
MSQQSLKGRFIALTPFILFVVLFLVSMMWFSSKISPLFSVMVALCYSFFTFPSKTPFNRKVEVFVEGASNTTVVSMTYIYIFTAVFSYIAQRIGSIDAAVKCSLYVIPEWFLLPGFFAVVGLFATSIGSSMGTIAAFLPIGVGIAAKVGVHPAAMAGLVVSGGMLGDNLSIISDTTIAAVKTTGTTMNAKLRENARLVLPAFLLTIVVLFFCGRGLSSDELSIAGALTWCDGIKLVPYVVLFALALTGLDVIAVLVIGIIVAVALGIYLGTFSFMQGTSLILEGFTKSADIHEVLLLSLFVAGLARIAEENGGIRFILEKLSKHIKSSRGAQASLSLLVFLVNAAVAINTIAILVTGPVAKSIGDAFGIKKARVAALVDIVACICQGILPYAPQLLLAASIAGVTSVSIVPYLYYQGFIFLVVVVSILCSKEGSAHEA